MFTKGIYPDTAAEKPTSSGPCPYPDGSPKATLWHRAADATRQANILEHEGMKYLKQAAKERVRADEFNASIAKL